MRIDAHQHFWLYDELKDSWITDNMQVIKRNFLPNDISQILKNNNFDGIVAVQADQSHRETEFLAELADVYKVIKAVIGWVDLRSPHIEEHLIHFKNLPIIKGFRHIIEAEEDSDFLVKDDFLHGIEALTKYNYTYDLLIHSRHYKSTLQCVHNNPNQKFMLDHIAKPPIKEQEFEDWASFIEQLAKYSNVYCKISGLVTQADWSSWQIPHFQKYINHITKSFGTNRICYGSDWPVCLLGATYEQVVQIVDQNLKYLNEEEKNDFWGEVATSFYGLN